MFMSLNIKTISLEEYTTLRWEIIKATEGKTKLLTPYKDTANILTMGKN